MGIVMVSSVICVGTAVAHLLRKAIKLAYLNARESVLSLLPKDRLEDAPSRPVDSVLVISQRRLGDIALEIPSLLALRTCCEEARLGIVAPRAYHPLLFWACRPDVLIEYPRGLQAMRALGAALRIQSWQVVVDLTTDYHLAPARLARASRAPIRIGFENSGRGHYFNIVIPNVKDEHMADRFRRPIELLGVDFRNVPSLPDLQEQPVTLPTKEPGSYLVGMHPGAIHWTQRWPAEYFADLAVRIHQTGDCCLVLGGESDRALIEEICRLSNGAVVSALTGESILQLAATLKRLDLLICNNSGPLHLADLLDIPTLSFMGPTVKELWWPRSFRARVLRCDDLACIGCNQGYCRVGTHACMTAITPDTAYEAFRSLKER